MKEDFAPQVETHEYSAGSLRDECGALIHCGQPRSAPVHQTHERESEPELELKVLTAEEGAALEESEVYRFLPMESEPEMKPSELGRFWQTWFLAVGEHATVDVVSATATLVLAEREVATRAGSPPPATDAHEIWAAAQLLPHEGIEDGVARIQAILREGNEPPAEIGKQRNPDAQEIRRQALEEAIKVCDSYKNETYAIDVCDTAKEIAKEIRALASVLAAAPQGKCVRCGHRPVTTPCDCGCRCEFAPRATTDAAMRAAKRIEELSDLGGLDIATMQAVITEELERQS